MAAEQNVQPVFKTGFCYLLLLGLTVFGVSTCYAEPSVSDAKKILETIITEQSKGMVKLVGFEKTGGIKQSSNGMKFYTLEYSATVEFQQKSWKQCDQFKECFSDFHFSNVAPRSMEAAVFSFKHFDAGSKVKTSGKMRFQKIEKGWLAA